MSSETKARTVKDLRDELLVLFQALDPQMYSDFRDDQIVASLGGAHVTFDVSLKNAFSEKAFRRRDHFEVGGFLCSGLRRQAYTSSNDGTWTNAVKTAHARLTEYLKEAAVQKAVNKKRVEAADRLHLADVALAQHIVATLLESGITAKAGHSTLVQTPDHPARVSVRVEGGACTFIAEVPLRVHPSNTLLALRLLEQLRALEKP